MTNVSRNYTLNTLTQAELPPQCTAPGFRFPVIISEVVSPSQFFWFFGENHRAIREITRHMGTFYDKHSGYELSWNELNAGLCVAALYTDGQWYRARVIRAEYGVGIEIFYVDYGSRCTVGLIHIRRLDSQYAHLPTQAFSGRIHGTAPDTNWSVEARQHFFNTVRGSKIMAAEIKSECDVLDPWSPPSFTLRLIDSTDGRDVAETLFLNFGLPLSDCQPMEDAADPSFILDNMSSSSYDKHPGSSTPHSSAKFYWHLLRAIWPSKEILSLVISLDIERYQRSLLQRRKPRINLVQIVLG